MEYLKSYYQIFVVNRSYFFEVQTDQLIDEPHFLRVFFIGNILQVRDHG